MSSDNPPGADNQQETSELNPDWVVGFVDGEGCFSVPIRKNPHIRSTPGWQLQPVFQVYQHGDHMDVLRRLRRFFGCGRIHAKGGSSPVYTYGVWSSRDLVEVVIPFFEAHPPRIKGRDFERFALIVRAMQEKVHLEPAGFERLVRLAYSMNAHGKQRARPIEEILAGSSETVRQAPADGR